MAIPLVAGCDREAPEQAQEQAQEQAESAGEKEVLSGEVDRSHAGELMPAIEVAHPDGRTLNLGALQGTPVLLNIWATWCAPCVVVMPMLDELAGDYGDDLRLITVSQDMQGASRVQPYFDQAQFANLEPWLDQNADLGFAFEGGVLPTTVLYDASGREVWRIVGGYDWTTAEARGLVDEGRDS